MPHHGDGLEARLPGRPPGASRRGPSPTISPSASATHTPAGIASPSARSTTGRDGAGTGRVRQKSHCATMSGPSGVSSGIAPLPARKAVAATASSAASIPAASQPARLPYLLYATSGHNVSMRQSPSPTSEASAP